jgi:carbonic anhydrase/acetyltransferase-like protein (isoleucine patch superfamily)
MLIEHRDAQPTVDPSAYVAPNAVLSGDVHVGAGARILFGAILTAEDGRVDVGERTVVMENALVRGRRLTPARLGDDVLVGPHAHVNGAVIEAGAFLATGSAVFPGAVVGARGEVRIHGVVHVNSKLAPDDFPGTVYGLSRKATAHERMTRQSAWFGAHRDDRIIERG